MPGKTDSVSMRVRIGDNELEVTGPKQFVEGKIDEFMKMQKGVPAKAGPSHVEPIAPYAPVAIATDKKMSVAQFFKKASPKSDVDRALVAGYYIEKHLRGQSFTASEIRDIIRGAKVRPPKNPNDTVAKNIRKGFMMPAGDKDGKMAYVLTSDGEETVAEAVKEQ